MKPFLLEYKNNKFLTPEMGIIDWIISDKGFIRLHGREQWYDDLYSDEELGEITSHVSTMRSLGAKRVCVFFNNDPNGYAIKNADSINKILAD